MNPEIIVGYSRVGRVLFVLSGLLYALCLALPAYRVLGLASGDVYPGWGAFLLGPIGLFGGHFSWLSNPALWLSWRSSARQDHSSAILWSVAALVLAATFLLHKSIPVGSSGNFQYSALYGYYIWLVSIALSATSGFIGAANRSASERASAA